MGLPNISFVKGQGGLGRPLTGKDFYSALIFYMASLPSGFTSSNRIKQFLSVSDAEAAGILADYSDATSASGSYLVTAAGATGDPFVMNVADIDSKGVARVTQIASYTRASTDTTAALVAAAIANAINAGTNTHGYSATATTATVNIVAPKRLGLFLNTGTPLSVVSTGTIAGTITQFTGGVASKLALLHYHIAEFFRAIPQGVLYVGIFAVPGTYTFAEITQMQQFATGQIRQIGILKDSASAYNAADMTLIDVVCKANDDLHKNLSAVYAADLSGVTDISTIADLSLLTANKVSDCIGQDGGNLGYFLFLTSGKSVTVLGAEVGTIASSKVSESIAWVGQSNISNGFECEVLAFANGKLFSDVSVTDGLLTLLNDRRHIFLRKFNDQSGSWFNDSHTAIAPTSDYAYIENNRTIDKACRGIFASLLPSLNGPLQLNDDGTLSNSTVAFLESEAGVNLDTMVRNGELSDYAVVINPAQSVLQTSKIVVAVTLLINGVARNISVPIGFKPKIS